MKKKDTDQTSVSIKPAKGRPWLQWVGKKPLTRVTAFPAQLIETFTSPLAQAVTPREAKASRGTSSGSDICKDWPDTYPKGGLLFHGDNKEVLAHLLANGFRGRVNLIYIDPPFDSGADYVRRVGLRGKTKTAKLEGETYTLGEQIQYTDIWANDSYLQFMYERLLLLRELLSESGSIYLHCDSRRVHFLRCLLEETLGPEMFQSQVVWQRSTPKGNMSRGYGTAYDSILFFSKSENPTWNQLTLKHSEEYVDKYYSLVEEGSGRRYQLTSLLSPATDRPNLTYSFHGHHRVWRYTKERMHDLERRGRVVVPGEGGMPREKRYLDEMKGVGAQDLWTDLYPVNAMAEEREDYPTQKPESLLQRIVEASSVPGDVIIDCFIGSGTTAAVAQKLGRRWIGCDINKGAIQTTAKRLQSVILEQVEAARKQSKQQKLIEDKGPTPAQLSFAVYQVNDYDFQVQHNEAVQLACEHIGITRSKADRFFDGTLGKRLVRITPFNHPLTQLDLEELKKELTSRPDESRDIVVVCLGKELAVDTWLADWNRLRKRGDVPNKIEVIELRTDPKYGKFFEHKPACARVDIKRKKGAITVEIKDFISPTILERLSRQEGVVAPVIDDWRQMVDTVMIDTAYDGKVFNIVLTDVPEKKDDFVQGKYELPAPKGKTTVAVKITDMLGEEVLVTAGV